VRQLGSLDELRHIGIGPLGVYLVRHLAGGHAALADEKQALFSVREYSQNRPDTALDDRLTGTISAPVYGPIISIQSWVTHGLSHTLRHLFTNDGQARHEAELVRSLINRKRPSSYSHSIVLKHHNALIHRGKSFR
jgi:hypothetical protein